MAVETYANDYETSLNGSVTASRPVTLTFRDTIPSTLSGGNFRIRVESEFLLVPAGGVSGLICTGCTTVEGSTASSHPDRAVVDQVLTRQGLLNSPGPMTTKGDIIYADTGGEPKRLPLGSAAQVLTADATGIPAWAAASGGGGGAASTNLARMYRNAAYTLVGTSTWTKFPFDTVDYDPNSGLTIASNRYTAPITGKYQVNALLAFTAAFAGQIILAIYVNGAIKMLIEDATASIAARGSAEVNLTAGDYVEIFYFSTVTPACLVTNPSQQNYMDISLVAASTRTSIDDQILAYLAAHPTGPQDTLLSIDNYRVFIFFRSDATSGWVDATNAVYTVPGGKTLYALKIWGTSFLNDNAARQARFRNTTDSVDVVSATNFYPAGGSWNEMTFGDASTATGNDFNSVAATKTAKLGLWNSTASDRAMGAILICVEV